MVAAIARKGEQPDRQRRVAFLIIGAEGLAREIRSAWQEADRLDHGNRPGGALNDQLFCSRRDAIRQPAGVRTSSSQYQSPMKKTRSSPSCIITIGLNRIVRALARSPSISSRVVAERC